MLIFPNCRLTCAQPHSNAVFTKNSGEFLPEKRALTRRLRRNWAVNRAAERLPGRAQPTMLRCLSPAIVSFAATAEWADIAGDWTGKRTYWPESVSPGGGSRWVRGTRTHGKQAKWQPIKAAICPF